MNKVDIVKHSDFKGFKSIDEYLLHTYGEKKLQLSKVDSNHTCLDVIGYTLNKRGFETVNGKYYELDEIEKLRVGSLNDAEDTEMILNNIVVDWRDEE